MAILNQESSLMEIVKLIGSDVLPDDQKLTLEIARVIRLGFLQQNAFHQEDTSVPMEDVYKRQSQYSTIHAICLLSQAKNKKIYQPSIQATAKRLAVPLPPYRHNLPHPNTAEYNHKSTTSRHHNQELL